MLNRPVLLSEKTEKCVGVVQDLVKVESRKKCRGLINGLDTMLKAITSNMDVDDEERLDAEITVLQDTQNTLKERMQKQL